MIDPYAAMRPRALKLTAKELLTLSFTQDKRENLLDFFWRVAAQVDARIAENTPKSESLYEECLATIGTQTIRVPAVDADRVAAEIHVALEAEYFAAACA